MNAHGHPEYLREIVITYPVICQGMVRTKSGILSSHSDNKHIIRYLAGAQITLDGRVIINIHNLLCVVDLGSFSFIILDSSFLMAEEIADWLHDGPVLDGACCTGWEERCEKEVVSRRDDNDIVILFIQVSHAQSCSLP